MKERRRGVRLIKQITVKETSTDKKTWNRTRAAYSLSGTVKDDRLGFRSVTHFRAHFIVDQFGHPFLARRGVRLAGDVAYYCCVAAVAESGFPHFVSAQNRA